MTTNSVPTVLPAAPGSDRYRSLGFADTAATLPASQSYDLLAAPGPAMCWLTAHELATPEVQLYEVCAQRLRTLRDHVRALFAAHVEGTAPLEEHLRAVNEALTSAPTAPLLAWDLEQGLRRVQTHPIDQAVSRALAALAADAADLLTGPEAGLLAVCGAAPCDRFLLRTHGRRHWCSTRCGDRVRAARAYARRTGAST
ncbi:ABATE domain-containing protein [Streptomyces scopuliridis]|uniref:ABATE domain-containing protein n=1 Tax=Streptomyces scopuliridis TaxID=452529 RepID=UPI003690FF83